MPKLYRNRTYGGIFRLNDDTSVTVLIEPTHNSWPGMRSAWLNPELRLSPSMVQSNLVEPSAGRDGVFHFNGKLFINLGEGERGFKKIRCVNNPDHYVKAIV